MIYHVHLCCCANRRNRNPRRRPRRRRRPHQHHRHHHPSPSIHPSIHPSIIHPDNHHNHRPIAVLILFSLTIVDDSSLSVSSSSSCQRVKKNLTKGTLPTDVWKRSWNIPTSSYLLSGEIKILHYTNVKWFRNQKESTCKSSSLGRSKPQTASPRDGKILKLALSQTNQLKLSWKSYHPAGFISKASRKLIYIYIYIYGKFSHPPLQAWTWVILVG